MTTNEKIARALGINPAQKRTRKQMCGFPIVRETWPDFEHDSAACVAAWPLLAERVPFCDEMGVLGEYLSFGWVPGGFTAQWAQDCCERRVTVRDSFCAAWVSAACAILGIEQ